MKSFWNIGDLAETKWKDDMTSLPGNDRPTTGIESVPPDGLVLVLKTFPEEFDRYFCGRMIHPSLGVEQRFLTSHFLKVCSPESPE